MQYYQKLIDELQEKTNTTLSFEWLAQATYYDEEHLGLKISTKDVADILVVGKDATFLAAAEEGLFWDLAPYIDDYPNLATIPEATRQNASYNGKMYGIPRSRTLARNGLGYRLDWLNNLNLAEPTDWESFHNMLYAFTYNDPDGNGVDDTVGLGLDQWTGVWNIMMVWFGVPNEWGLTADDKLIYKVETPEYITALKAFRDLYAEGVINNGANGVPDLMDETLTPGKARDNLLRAGLAGCGVQVLDDQRKVETYFESDDVGLATADDPIYTLQGYVDTGKGAFCLPTTGMNNLIAISKKNIKTEEQLRRALQFLNDLNNGDILNLIEYGWEGLTYKIDLGAGFAIQPAVIYQVKGAKIESVGETTADQLKTGFVEIPVGIQWGPDLMAFRPYVFAEPFIGYQITSSDKGNASFSDWSAQAKNKFEYGFGLGGGIEIASHIQLSAQWFKNLGNMFGDSAKSSSEAWEAAKDVKNFQGIKVTLGILF